jgi:hypothetical protein
MLTKRKANATGTPKKKSAIKEERMTMNRLTHSITQFQISDFKFEISNLFQSKICDPCLPAGRCNLRFL